MANIRNYVLRYNLENDMATVKIKFRQSNHDDGSGTIFYQIIHNRVARQKKTSYCIYDYEWSNFKRGVITTDYDAGRRAYLSEINEKIMDDILLLNKIINALDQRGEPYTAEDILNRFVFRSSENYMLAFMESVIRNLKSLGKIRTSETYATTLNSFRRFRGGRDLLFDIIDSDLMISYEAYLHNNGVGTNTSSFYMRNLRAVYNRAVDKGLTQQKFPFRHVYTGVEKTVKRAVSLKTIKQIKEMDLSDNPVYALARDMFLFSFYTRGMAFVDMAYLRKKDLSSGILSYRRHKTGQQLFVRWEKCMQEIVDKYDTPDSLYLLPVIRSDKKMEERKQYIYSAHNINRSLKIIGRRLALSVPLTMYVARHSWASIAKSKNVPLSVISEGMGHDSETTTRIYLASLDTVAIDKANSMILKSL